MYIAFFAAIFFLILMISPLKVLSRVSLIDGTNVTSLRISFWGISYNLLKPKEKADKKAETEKKDSKKMSINDIKIIFDVFYGVLKILKSGFHVTLFSFNARLGLQDAADTGIATGAAYGIIYNIIGVIDKTFDLQEHNVSITPVFTKECFDFEFEGRFKLRLFHCFRILKSFKKLKG